MSESPWPERLWIVRHGESAGNVARIAAMEAGQAVIDIAGRDVDVPLSALGERQSAVLGRWFASQAMRPDVVFISPYLRARRTAALMRENGGIAAGPAEFHVDERLREKEFGVLDRLTRLGIEERYPEQVEFRRSLGKFYHRPPGGESWCDVILRLRSTLDTVLLQCSGKRVLIVGHQVVVLCMRYLLEGMDEEAILAIDAAGDVANCAVTEYAFDPAAGREGGLVLQRYNFVAPLEREETPVTAEPDVQAGVR